MDLVSHHISKLDHWRNTGWLEPADYEARKQKTIDEGLKPPPPPGVRTVYMGHVRRTLVKKTVAKRCAKFGRVLSVEMVPCKNEKPRKNWWAVFVEFESQQQAYDAIWHLGNDFPLDWPEQLKPLYVKWAPPRDRDPVEG